MEPQSLGSFVYKYSTSVCLIVSACAFKLFKSCQWNNETIFKNYYFYNQGLRNLLNPISHGNSIFKSLENLTFHSNHRLPSRSLPSFTNSKCLCYGSWLRAVNPSLQSSLQWSCHPDQLPFVSSSVTHQQSRLLSQSSYHKGVQAATAIWQACELETASLVQDELLQTKLCCGIAPSSPGQSCFTHSMYIGESLVSTAGLPIFLFLISHLMTEQWSMKLGCLKIGEESVKQKTLLRMIWTQPIALLISLRWIFFKHKHRPLTECLYHETSGIWFKRNMLIFKGCVLSFECNFG